MARDANGHGSAPKLTPELAEKIFIAIRQGSTLESASAYAGVARSTFKDWCAKGRKPGARDPYKGFVTGLDEALATFEVAAVAQIAKAGQEGEWQASAWRLERRFPDRYGRRTRLDGSLTVSAAPVLDVSKLTIAELETLRALLAKAQPEQQELTGDQRPALELLEGGQT